MAKRIRLSRVVTVCVKVCRKVFIRRKRKGR